MCACALSRYAWIDNVFVCVTVGWQKFCRKEHLRWKCLQTWKIIFLSILYINFRKFLPFPSSVYSYTAHTITFHGHIQFSSTNFSLCISSGYSHIIQSEEKVGRSHILWLVSQTNQKNSGDEVLLKRSKVTKEFEWNVKRRKSWELGNSLNWKPTVNKEKARKKPSFRKNVTVIIRCSRLFLLLRCRHSRFFFPFWVYLPTIYSRISHSLALKLA